jgi:hypothetical protein
MLWRWCGAWILLPVTGAFFGAIATVAFAWMILKSIDFQGPGAHGGGDIAVFLVLGSLVVSAAVGAIVGGFLFAIPTLIIVWTNRRKRAAVPIDPCAANEPFV